MNKVVKAVVLGLVLVPVALLAGCNKKCGSHEPVMQHKLEKMKGEYGGK